ncbi:uncharacterized protein NECHADRAFT_94347 [Fusarium vanettenii 77-13-4]|uniref:Cyclin-dependent kinase n=1 Tax=Fusarium vanettenii (strain ATCC MYA-4622 / CBS 123669 / FGSC 9596 / NRRL 45880 / 77-13-4) TaxID=660122 RepID=C7Z8Q2_FUSV7|nr:uncharacterized protein NECHADRAFT_94347 [Fusarium vanettenii 77-13-4]EEU39406.1 hypothetical protein NECHADRAFT_94347 [Fusarium vanettenii 77-13-4]
MTPDRPLGEIALNPNRVTLPPPFKTADARPDATTEIATGARRGGDLAALGPADALSRVSHQIASTRTTAPTAAAAAASIAKPPPVKAVVAATMQRNPSLDRDDGSTQSHPLSTAGSQDTNMTASTDPAFTPPASDPGTCAPGPSSQDSQLLQLSEIAAAQDRMDTDAWSSRKRMADGEVKSRTDSQSPVKGHSRNPSAVSRASATGGYIGELSAELKTRLSYAMIKVNHGWQSNSLEEVETLASHAASPTSSTSTVHRRQGSSASPRIRLNAAPSSSAPLPYDSARQRRKSNSPPRSSLPKPTLAPPAAIQPSLNTNVPRSNPRRNSNPHRTPTLLSYSHTASPHTPAQLPTLQTGPRSRTTGEQDAIESLLFMSSPGNSANLKHAFSPTGSPGPNFGAVRPLVRHALPSGPRKPLPSSQRHAQPTRRPGFDKSPMPPPPGSPMDLDSPQQPYGTPGRGTPRRRMNGGSSHLRGALSLPSGLGGGNGTARKMLRDEDIERMLDQAAAEAADSSDDEEIQIPPPRRGVAGVMQA